MDSGRVEVHFHGQVIINRYIEYNRNSVDIRNSTIQDAYNTGRTQNTHSTSSKHLQSTSFRQPIGSSP
jgi:hypothetical protein